MLLGRAARLEGKRSARVVNQELMDDRFLNAGLAQARNHCGKYVIVTDATVRGQIDLGTDIVGNQ